MIKRLKNIYHFWVSKLGSVLYGRPSRKIFVVGVTGTKGKTTVLELINAGLEEAGKKTALISSIRRKICSKDMSDAGNSMPGRFALQKFIDEAQKEGCDYALIEVTSEGVVQHRHRNIDFDAGIFINLHPEHIESHGSFEKYRQAKLDFFRWIKSGSKKATKYFLINKDDENAGYFTEVVGGKNSVTGLPNQAGVASKIFFSKSSKASKMPGEFNKWNLGAAEAFLEKVAEVPASVVERAFAKFTGVPGRMEFVVREPFEVIVDYAHTPGSLEQVYKALSGNEEKKLICVLGSAGGGRDKWKRPEFGKIAARYCKEIILTDEDPYEEDTMEIISDIKNGIPASFMRSKIHEMPDRKEAIRWALHFAQRGDKVIITGKGSEKSIHVAGGKKVVWSDVGIVRGALAELSIF